MYKYRLNLMLTNAKENINRQEVTSWGMGIEAQKGSPQRSQ